ncbi:S-layer homology domain-containing protein [Lysinibacillus capsici]|uniref:S-layer homology domain-containing protein n=1 Tax=Lysinibacillus capsici TaxID=2115968 RepID=UPI0027311F9D|nr:S-layer homology domain-containing protein [Lysinibacillus capsici]MDP1395385.1 S-layer homology domain-containing protein [Lysinibacillus capsici]MDP1415892.1 S-layer homology domain-containing protein [Lysinibacillus capsici]MDP1431748.1 S-layer homology domain-containing protein [Lysinibacillus capsici]
MGKKILTITLCLVLVAYSQLMGLGFVSPLKVEAAACDSPDFPSCIQDLTQASWKDDTNNGFVVSGIPGDNGINLFTYSNGSQFPAGYYFDADEYSPPKSIRISAGESFAGGIFDLKSLKINTINKHPENDALSITIQGYDGAGNPKGNPVIFKTIANHEPIYDIPINIEGINSFVITASVNFIPTVQAGLWDLTFTQFTIDIPNNSPPTITNGAITSSNITTSGVQLDWAKASDDITAQEDLEYQVYQSSSNNIDTVSTIELNGTPLGGYTKDSNSFNVTGLAANTTYYFNIIVKDTNGNKSAYLMQEVTTLALNKPPTSSNGSIDVNEGQVYTFTSTSFAFSDEDAGDTLQQIQISTIPNSGQLFLDNNNNQQFDGGEAITNGMTISKANLDAGNLRYITENGTSSSFTFKVSDGIDFSTDYTMELVVNARPAVIIIPNDSSPTNSNSILITLVFSESVTGFMIGDIEVTNGNVAILSGSGTTYTALISPIADGAVKIKIPEKVVANSGGALNKASNELQIFYDSTPPTDIELNNTTVQEKKPIGTTVGTLAAVDTGSSQTFTYSLQSGDTSFFTIDGNVLKTKAMFEFDTKNSYKITIRVTDEAGNTLDKEFTIQITKNHAPSGSIIVNGGQISTSSINVTLNLTATDLEGEAIEMRFSNDGITWSSWESKISTKSWTLSHGEGSKTVYMQLRDTAGNISNTFSDTIVLDTTPPVITGVTNNGVYNTDVTISFNEGTATLNGATFSSGTTVSTSGNYTLVATDSAGNTTTITFVIDKALPKAVEVEIKSNNLDPTKAKVGDTITLTMKTDKNIQAPIITISGKAAIVTGASTNWQATYVIDNGDLEGTAPFTINFKDLLGNSAIEVTDVTDGSYVIVDSVKPTVKKVTMASNNANPTVAKVDDVITIDFETSEDIQSPNVSILGQTANVNDKGDGDAKTWQASYTLKSIDSDGPISFTIDFQDIAGNEGLQVTEISSGTIVIFDKISPEITTYFPAHQAINVQPVDNLVLTFDEKILPVTSKNIVIRNATDNQIVETIAVTQANVSITNETVTVNPTLDLAHNTTYSIQIDAGAFTDVAGNAYKGITNNTSWNFTTSALQTYTVTYDSNGSDGGIVPTDSKQYKNQDTITVLGNTGNLMKAGYTFVGWNTKADGKGVTYKIGQTIQMGKGNLILYALWSKNNVPGDGGSSTPSPTPTPDPVAPSNQLKINVVDQSMPDDVLLQTVLTRVLSNGSFQDTVNFTVANANEFLRILGNKEDKRSRLVIPNMEPPASETKVILDRDAAKRLIEGKSHFSIAMGMVKIDVPFTSMNDFNEDIYFRIVPIKDALRQKAIEDRAKQAEIVLQQGNGANVKLVGQPISIDTNLQNRQVTLLLPLPVNLTSAQRENMMVYVEHSNGTAEIIRGRFAEFTRGQTGIVFDVEHFSTFSLLYVEQAQEEVPPEKEPIEVDSTFASYIHGYTDGTFRPNVNVTRAQMAAMLARNLSANHAPEASNLFYADTATSWAKNDIEYIRTEGIMQGRHDRSFGPNEVITRAQMAVIAVRWIDKQCVEGATDTSYCEINTSGETYRDVAVTHWAAKEINRISAIGIMVGSGNGEFRPEEKLTRAQAVKVLNRIFNRPIPTEDTEQIFKDIPKDHWAYFEIQAAAK